MISERQVRAATEAVKIAVGGGPLGDLAELAARAALEAAERECPSREAALEDAAKVADTFATLTREEFAVHDHLLTDDEIDLIQSWATTIASDIRALKSPPRVRTTEG